MGRDGEGYFAGLRAGLPFALLVGVLAVTPSTLARSLGWDVLAPIVFSVANFSVAAPFLEGGPFCRALEGQMVLTTSWAMAIRGGGRVDWAFMIGATVPQYVAWTVGTTVGVPVLAAGGAALLGLRGGSS